MKFAHRFGTHCCCWAIVLVLLANCGPSPKRKPNQGRRQAKQGCSSGTQRRQVLPTSQPMVLPAKKDDKLEASDLYPIIKAGTFQVLNGNGSGGTGTGFFITPDVMATNLHVVDIDKDDLPDDPANIYIGTLTQNNQKQFAVQEIIAYDAEHDIALLRFGPGQIPPSVKPLPIDTKLPKIGSRVYALGNPLGQVIGNFTDGQVSMVGNISGVEPEVIVFTCPISPGNSGGPVVNEYGNVVGVASASASDDRAQNINIAHPSAHITALLNQTSKTSAP